MKYILLVTTSLMLSGCLLTTPEHETIPSPAVWTASTQGIEKQTPQNLHGWWKGFNDPALNQLVDIALKGSPDRRMAEARILEARGLRRAVNSALFPQLQASGSAGRAKNLNTNFKAGELYDAGFDASYEIDIFGRNRSNSDAADANFEARSAEYHDVSLTLVSEVTRAYVELRAAQKQSEIAYKNLEAQQKTLELVRQQKELGEAPQLDVERSEGLVNTTKASIPEFDRQADNARLRLSVLTGEMPEKIKPLVEAKSDVISDIKPVLLAPAEVINQRPDVRAAQFNLEAQTSLTKAEIASIFPTVTLAGFFGIADTALIDSTTIWSSGISAAVSLLNFGRISGNIDAAKARETQSFELWRKTVLQAVTDVEISLTDYAHIKERKVTLQQAAANAERSLNLSQQLYKEGEVSFLDVLDAQRTVNNANAEVVGAEEALSLSLVALYKSLGVY
ncbi:MAG: hypothetical protein DI586_04215 [Micavibrio aeruginosavorus]|uniref:RND transporter n=1 Tax=Micavibrio aeruginosavorus TaxID=349221 RepID=A0A2W5FPF9_9BACT|nr:MAG: hypothetical protein DI586_04215 [Micavibrio aeruginosavorus]